MWVAVTVGFIRATHVWVKFFVAAAARFIPPFMTRARKLQQTTFKNNGDGNGHGQWQWLWLLLSLVQKCCTIPSEPSRADGSRRVSRILFYRECAACNLLAPPMTRRVFIGAGLPCLASRPLLCRQVRWTFLLICTWAFLGWAFTFSEDIVLARVWCSFQGLPGFCQFISWQF